MILKTDQEPVVLDLKRETIKEAAKDSRDIMPEESPVKDSQSNGAAENAVREVQGMIRTYKDHVESKCDWEIPADHPLVPWTILHAGRAITCYKIQRDGRTAYEKIRGKKMRTHAVPIGERVLYQLVKHGNKSEKMESKWQYGIYGGFIMQSTEVLVSGPGGLEKARDVRRTTDGKQWDKNALENMRVHRGSQRHHRQERYTAGGCD